MTITRQDVLEKAYKQTYNPPKSRFEILYPKQHNEIPVALHTTKAQPRRRYGKRKAT